MTTEQIKKREWLSRAKSTHKQLKKLQKQIIKDKLQKKFFSEIDISDDVLEQEIKNNIERYAKLLEKMITLDEEARKAILTIHDDTLETILVRYYLLYESFPKVAEKMIYKPRHVQRLFYQAIEKIIIPAAGGTV